MNWVFWKAYVRINGLYMLDGICCLGCWTELFGYVGWGILEEVCWSDCLGMLDGVYWTEWLGKLDREC